MASKICLNGIIIANYLVLNSIVSRGKLLVVLYTLNQLLWEKKAKKSHVFLRQFCASSHESLKYWVLYYF